MQNVSGIILKGVHEKKKQLKARNLVQIGLEKYTLKGHLL